METGDERLPDELGGPYADSVYLVDVDVMTTYECSDKICKNCRLLIANPESNNTPENLKNLICCFRLPLFQGQHIILLCYTSCFQHSLSFSSSTIKKNLHVLKLISPLWQAS